MRDFHLLTDLDDESASDLVELTRLSRSATDQAILLELARSSSPPDAWFDDEAGLSGSMLEEQPVHRDLTTDWR